MSERQQVIVHVPMGAVLPTLHQADNTKQYYCTANTLKAVFALKKIEWLIYFK